MLRKMFTKKMVATEAILLLVVAIAALAVFVSPVAATMTAGTICILAGVAVQLYTGSDFINRHFGWLVIGSSLLAAVAALTAGVLSGQIVMGIISAVAALLIILAVTVLKKQWVHLVFAVISMVAMITMVLPVKAAEPAVTEDESDEDESKDDEILAEIKGLRADLAELMQANEELRRMYEEYVARCKDCPICNGSMTLDELSSSKTNKTSKGVKHTSNGIAYVGTALGDGKGNGAGLTPVKPVYDDANKTEYKAPDKDVDFTDDKDDDKDVDVDDNHGDYPHAGDDQDDKPQVEDDDKTEKTQDLTYSVEGNVVTVSAPENFVAVDDVLSYIVAKGGVTVTAASAEANTLKITFDASEDAKIVVCKGMFKSGDVKSAELEVSVKKAEKAEEEDPSSKDDDDSNKSEKPENPAPEAPTPAEMVVSAINVQTICDTDVEGNPLQYLVVAEGQNIDYSKLAVSAGTIGADGTWTIVAPAESGSATVSFGDVSATVNFTVVKAPQVDGPVTPDEPEGPSIDEPAEEVKGILTAVSLYDSSVVCGSVIQGEISCEGNVNWSEVEVSGLNGLSYDIVDGIITINTSDVASSYEITVSYNGSSVSATFDVEGVENPDIDWE